MSTVVGIVARVVFFVVVFVVFLLVCLFVCCWAFFGGVGFDFLSVCPRQRWTVLSFNSMLVARVNGLVTQGTPLNETDRNALVNGLLQGEICAILR